MEIALELQKQHILKIYWYVENSQRLLLLTTNFLLLPYITLGIFIKIPNNRLLAEPMLILPNTMSLISAVLSVLKKMCLHLLIFKGMKSCGFKLPVCVFW